MEVRRERQAQGRRRLIRIINKGGEEEERKVEKQAERI
jgi:hypothetical protein